MPSLGRLVEHDERSRLYQAARAGTQRSVLWGHHAPVLDQGDLGSCTGNATAQLINTDYFAASRKHGYLKEADAVQLYETATVVDGIPNNTYPPNDGGSTGLGAAKAGVKLGYFTGYKHAFGIDHAAATVQLQPCITGVNWYADMFEPDSKGYVVPSGDLSGGHELVLLGVNYRWEYFTWLNSWWENGKPWGDNGRVHIARNDYARLLDERGDVTAPLPKPHA